MKFKTMIFLLAASFITLSANQVRAEEKKAVGTAVGSAVAQTNYENTLVKVSFLKIEGIETSSTQKGFEDYLQINSWSTGVSSYDRTTTVQDFYITVPKSDTSTSLFRALVTSKVIPSMTLVVLDPKTIGSNNPKILFRFVMRNATISNFQMSGYDTAIENPSMLEQISLKYEAGSYEGGDLEKNKKAASKDSVNFVVPGKGLGVLP